MTKPDGWHTYHVCGGMVREITRVQSRPDSRFAELTCLVCGDWCEILVSPESTPSVKEDAVPAATPGASP